MLASAPFMLIYKRNCWDFIIIGNYDEIKNVLFKDCLIRQIFNKNKTQVTPEIQRGENEF